MQSRIRNDFTVAQKIKRARDRQRTRTTREMVAELAGKHGFPMSYVEVETIERGQSKSGARTLVPILVKEWKIPEDWFYDGQDTEPYRHLSTSGVAETRSVYDLTGDYVDIPLHLPLSGKVILINPVESLKVPAGLAKGDSFAVAVADVENAPRFRPGHRVIFRPKEFYADGAYVAAEHPTELVRGPDDKLHRRIYIRRYVYKGGRFMLVPRDAKAPSFDAAGFDLKGLAIAKVTVHAEGRWFTIEICEDGLPYDEA